MSDEKSKKIYSLDLDQGEFVPIQVSIQVPRQPVSSKAIYCSHEQDFMKKLLTVRNFDRLRELGTHVDSFPFCPISNSFDAIILYLSTSNLAGIRQEMNTECEISGCKIKYDYEKKMYECSVDIIQDASDGFCDLSMEFLFEKMTNLENISINFEIQHSNSIPNEIKSININDSIIISMPKGVWFFSADVRKKPSLTIFMKDLKNFLPFKIKQKFTRVIFTPLINNFLNHLFVDKIRVEKYGNICEMINFDGQDKFSHDMVKINPS